jgi:hypothetical protein
LTLCINAVADPSTQIAALEAKPLYEFTEAEVDAYLKHLQAAEPDLRKRVVRLARKNIGQPYDIYLLGEMPFETHDPQPIYCLTKSDCVVFSEHTYAMALSGDWPAFMKMLQRIRYRDGQIGVATRNHYTEADWNPSNRWLVRDVTAELAGDAAVAFEERVDRAKFLKNRYGLAVDIPIEQHHDVYLPYSEIDRALPHLADGDFVNVVRGTIKPGPPAGEILGGSVFVGHVGLVAHGADGTLHMIHSTPPTVREEPLDAYISRSLANLSQKAGDGIAGPAIAGPAGLAGPDPSKPRLVGFKFLRLEDRPLQNLRKIDGDEAPVVKLPLDDASAFWRARLK